jgi:integrase
MARKLSKTSTPGIFRRHKQGCEAKGRCECPYVVIWRQRGRQATETFRTLADAREAKREREAGAARGEEIEARRVTLDTYAREWVERYQGTGRRGYRHETRDEDRRLLERYALRYFPPELRLVEVSPRAVADFIGWLTRQSSRRGGTLSDSGVRNAFGPLSACLATARREGLILHNPASEAVLPHRPPTDEDSERARPFPGETMELVVSLIHPDHRPMFALLAVTGLRRSELLALEGRHLHLSGEQPYIAIRRRLRRQRANGLVLGPLKSRYARREVPIPLDVADRLAALHTPKDALAFTTIAATPLDPDNTYRRVLQPACAEARVEWAGFHTFRHTVASRLFAEGRNAVQVQRWLGHHSPSFTLDTYVHLLDADLGEPLRVNTGSTGRRENAANTNRAKSLKVA